MTNLFRPKWIRVLLAALVAGMMSTRTAFASVPAQSQGGGIFDNLIFVVIGGILLALFASLAGGTVIAALAVLGSRFFRRNLPTDEEMTQLKTELNREPSARPRRIKIGQTAEPFVLAAVGFVAFFIVISVVLSNTPVPIYGEAVQPTAAPASATLPKEGDFAAITAGLPKGNAQSGEKLFASSGCAGCHGQKKGERLVGPSFYNLWQTAATRVPGLSAKEYIYQSIVNPNAHIVETFQPNLMPQNFATLLSPQQMADILAWIEEKHSHEQ